MTILTKLMASSAVVEDVQIARHAQPEVHELEIVVLLEHGEGVGDYRTTRDAHDQQRRTGLCMSSEPLIASGKIAGHIIALANPNAATKPTET